MTTTQIAAAALAVVDREGLDALSMRTVAGRLGVAPMSLYRYVTDRDELERLVVDLVLAGIDPGLPCGGGGGKLAALAEQVRLVAAAHPAVVPLLLLHRHSSPASLRWGEAVMAVLADAGFTGKRRAIAFRAVLAYVFGALQVEYYGPLPGAGTRALSELSAEEFPLLAATAGVAGSITPDEEFRRGFAIVLDGLGL